MPRVAIIGAGLIGRAWASVFVRAGWDAALFDAAPGAAERAIGLIAQSLEETAEHGLVRDPKGAAARVRVAADLADALAGAAFVQESLPERRDVKEAIFADLDRLAAPETVLASSTSGIVPSLFTENLTGRHRCVVGHPVNPPHLVPLVEVCGAPWTAAATIARAQEVYEAVGQVPIVVRREIDGFILNRLQAALIAEAFRLVGEGYVSPQDCDKTLKDGLGLRWSFMGPFETIELNAPAGIPDYVERYGPGLRLRQEQPAAPAVYDADNVARIMREWGRQPAADWIAARMVWRDGRLAALRAHKSAQTDG